MRIHKFTHAFENLIRLDLIRELFPPGTKSYLVGISTEKTSYGFRVVFENGKESYYSLKLPEFSVEFPKGDEGKRLDIINSVNKDYEELEEAVQTYWGNHDKR